MLLIHRWFSRVLVEIIFSSWNQMKTIYIQYSASAVHQKTFRVRTSRMKRRAGLISSGKKLKLFSIYFNLLQGLQSLRFRQVVHPVRDHHQMFGQVDVVGFRVRIILWIPSDHDAAVLAVDLVVTRMAVVKLSSRFTGSERIPEGVPKVYRALRHKRNAIGVRKISLMEAVPVDRRGSASHLVDDVDHNQVAFADVNWRCRNLSVDRHHATFYAISSHAMFVEAIIARPTGRTTCSACAN